MAENGRNGAVPKVIAALVAGVALLVLGGWLQKIGSTAWLTAKVENFGEGIARLEADHRRFEDTIGEQLRGVEVAVRVLESYRTNHLVEHQRIQDEIDKAKETLAAVKAQRAVP